MVEIDGGEAEKIVAAESSNSRHLPRLSWSLGCGWQIPKGSKVKTQKRELSWLNTDSASRCNPAHAGAGRLVRDALHRFIMGSEAGVGYCNVLKDESWVVKIGLEMAWNMGVCWLLLVFDYEDFGATLDNDSAFENLNRKMRDCM
ncbi:hypothetical protein DKX38_008356 [Salix brachista]|uniref:RNase H type-1 domain-containing protein n=1 Tax=Salix brachista TaxID=2182728 RepID=A0A5N5MR03_9ROSI|nr:hypothetical protein DKX38_008356 [Salix brachista]